MKNLGIIFASLCLMIITYSVYNYYIIELPKEFATKQKDAAIEDYNKKNEKLDSAQKLQVCLDQAGADYSTNMSPCLHPSGIFGCAPVVTDRYDKNYKEARDACFKQYPQ